MSLKESEFYFIKKNVFAFEFVLKIVLWLFHHKGAVRPLSRRVQQTPAKGRRGAGTAGPTGGPWGYCRLVFSFAETITITL